MGKARIMIPEKEAWARAIKNLVERGEATVEQEEEMVKRLNRETKRRKWELKNTQ